VTVSGAKQGIAVVTDISANGFFSFFYRPYDLKLPRN
jgi:hypothetical protein